MPKVYTPAELAEAVRRVRAGEIIQNKASLDYKIPKMTLSDNVNGKVSSSSPGCKPVLSDEQESTFARVLIDLADQGFGLPKGLVKVKVAPPPRTGLLVRAGIRAS
ncbi:ligand-dependent corepressor [Elysia marginata]|uniref:Ligand-dependent corepressor n=1 Tax=Elysia marginata TaxID=1093978 RepID=A0AAV4ENE8_9GAST|nr:ligand-dependent corepressor [Elysia marginata]